MIKVQETASTLQEGVKNMMSGAKEDYIRWSTNNGKKELSGYSKEQVEKWDDKTKITEGKKYIKIVQDTGVFAFVVKEDFKQFKKGDVLKAAGYNAPALNSPRGNVLTGNYPIQWTGPLYLRTLTLNYLGSLFWLLGSSPRNSNFIIRFNFLFNLISKNTTS